MGKLFKTIFYAVSFGLITIVVFWILLANRGNQYIPINIGLIFMYVLLILAIFSILFLGFRELLHKPKTAKIVFIGVVILLILILFGYTLDGAEILKKYAKYGVTTQLKSKFIGGSLIATWIVLGSAVVLAITSSVLDYIKRM